MTRIFSRWWVAGGIPGLSILLLVLLLGSGCQQPLTQATTVEIERVIDFHGTLRLTLPTGETSIIAEGESLPSLPEDALLAVLSGELTGTLLGKIIILQPGQIARIIHPSITAERIIRFTGELKIILPDGRVVMVRRGDPLPILPPGTRIEVISGELVLLRGDERISLTGGQVGRLEPRAEAEWPEIELGDISPASPYKP